MIKKQWIERIKLKIKGDGMWQKRVYGSSNGAVSIISIETEKVLHHEVIMSHCQTCIEWQQKNDSNNQ